MIRCSIALLVMQGAIFCSEQSERKIQADREMKVQAVAASLKCKPNGAVRQSKDIAGLEKRARLERETEGDVPISRPAVPGAFLDCRFPVSRMGRGVVPWELSLPGEHHDFWTYMYSDGSVHDWDLVNIDERAPHSGIPSPRHGPAGVHDCPVEWEVWSKIIKTSQFGAATTIECPCRPYPEAVFSSPSSPDAVRYKADFINPDRFAILFYATLLGKCNPSLINIDSSEYREGICESPYWHEPTLSSETMLETFERIRKQAFADACSNCKSLPHPLSCEFRRYIPVACQFVRGFAAAPKNSSNGEPLLLDAIRGIVPGERTLLLTV